MQCSYFGRQKKTNSPNFEDAVDEQILQHLNKHSLLLKKLNSEIKTTDKNQKDQMDHRASEPEDYQNISVIELDESSDDEGADNAVAALPPSLPVSLPLDLLNDSGLRVRADLNPTSDENISDCTAPDPREVEVVYNDITQ